MNTAHNTQVPAQKMSPKKTGSTKSTTATNSASNDGGGGNRPKNHLITDAASPFTFSFLRFGKVRSITVNQTPKEETWRECYLNLLY